MKHKGIKYIGILLIVICFICYINKFNIFKGCSPEYIKGILNSFGVFAPVVFILLFTIVPLTLFPDAILAVAGGLMFGLTKGFIYTMMGALCGATLAFYISRVLGRSFVKKIIKHDIADFGHNIQKNGFLIILLLRLIPLLPFDVISYSVGFSKIKYKDFFWATLFGTIPGILVYANLGAQSTKIGSTSFYISVALLILLFVGSIFLKKKVSFNKLQNTLNKG